MRVMNRKGQGMSTNTIILLILGLAVLAALIIGFSGVWKNFTQSTGATNVDEIAEQCKTTCSLNEKFKFCSSDTTIRIQEEELEYKTSCGVLATVPEFQRLGVRECAKIECSVPCESIRVNDELGSVADTVPEGYHDVSAFAAGLADGKVCIIPMA